MSSAIAAACPRRSCGACGAISSSTIYKQGFVVPEGYPLPAEYAVVGCNTCGFVYADVPATQEDYNRFYREWSKYDDAATSTGSGLSRYDAERLSVIATDVAHTLPSVNLRVLDAGCATGGLLLALRKVGFTNISGLDPSPHCCAICRDKGFEAYSGTIAVPPKEMPQFDCVVLSHVLEHVYEIPTFFAAVRRMLVPGGYLYLETPDASRYVDYLYAPFQEFNTEHINHFSQISLKNTACRFGFESMVVRQKVLQTSESHSYPAVFGIFRLLTSPANGKSLQRDEVLPRAIARYVSQSAALMQQVNSILTSQLADQETVVLWGAGQLAMKLLALPSLRHKKVVAVVDSNPVLHGKRLAGAPVIDPDALTDGTAPIIIATLLHEEGITARIRQLGFPNPIVRLSVKADTMEGTQG